MAKATKRSTSASARRAKRSTPRGCDLVFVVADRADCLGYGPAGAFSFDPDAPWTFKFSLTGEGRGGVIELKRDAAMKLALTVLELNCLMSGHLSEEERKSLSHSAAGERVIEAPAATGAPQ